MNVSTTRFLVFLAMTAAWDCFAQVQIEPPSRAFSKDGGGGAIITSGSGTWNATSADGWITITPRTSGSVGESCIYVVAANLSADTRQGAIQINDKTHVVYQSGYDATLTPTVEVVDLNGGMRTVSITTSAGVAWTATTSDAWITVNTPAGFGPGQINYTVAPYAGVVNRSGSILIGGKALTITQTGTDVNIAPQFVKRGHTAGIVILEVAALVGTSWSVSPNASWLSVADPGSGSGPGQVIIGVGTNPSFLERTGTVAIGSLTLTVQQDGNPSPIMDIQPKAATAAPTGAFANIAVYATPDAPWRAESHAPWIILSGSNGAGNGNINYVASANPTLEPRHGVVRVHAPVVLPKVDLTWSLLAYIPTNIYDLSGWRRHIESPIEQQRDGSVSHPLQGQNIVTEANAGSFAIRFTIDALGTVYRLCGFTGNGQKTGLYVSADDRLVLETVEAAVISDYTFSTGTEYQVLATADTNHVVKLYAGQVGETNMQMVASAQFPVTPFPLTNALPSSALAVGYAEQPNPGNFNGGVLRDFRFYGRPLNEDEADTLIQYGMSSVPFGPQSAIIPPVTSYNMRGNAVLSQWQRAPTVYPSQTQTIIPAIDTPTAAGWSPLLTITHVTNQVYQVTDGYNGMTAQLVMPVDPRWWTNLTTIDLKAHVGGDTCGFGGSTTLKLRLKGEYFNGTTLPYTNVATVVASTGNQIIITQEESFNLGAFIFQLGQPLKTITLEWERAQTDNHSICKTNHRWRMGSIDQKTFPPQLLSGLHQCDESVDRLGIGRRAVTTTNNSESTSGLFLWSHQSSFTNQSATYNIWLRCNELPQSTELWNLFGRGAINLTNTSLLLANINSDGDIVISDTITTNVFPARLNTEHWHMVTVVGGHGANLAVFVDGDEAGNSASYLTYPFGANLQNNIYSMRVGGWRGSLGNVDFYDGVLSSAQIKQIYDLQKPLFIDHVLSQGVVAPELTPLSASIPVTGGAATTTLTLSPNVVWTVTSSDAWLQITSATSGSGATTVSVHAVANPNVESRAGTITIAGKTFTVTQEGVGATVDSQDQVLGTDGGSFNVDVTTSSGANWTASTDVSWLTVALGQTGTGSGSALIVADPMTNPAVSRTGTLTVAGESFYVTQRGYNLSINPPIAQIGSNAGAGEVGVSAPLSAVWEAIVTVPWINIVGGTTGIGDGVLRYSVMANETGQPRTGKIVIAGEVYTISQKTQLTLITATEGNGAVSGAGDYDTNADATLAAVPGTDYVFSHWAGGAVGRDNPLILKMDSDKTVTAHFIPKATADALTAELASTQGYYTRTQLQELAIGRPFLAKDQGTGKIGLTFGLLKSTTLNNITNWSNMTINSSDVIIENGKVKLQLAPTNDIEFYILSGGN